DQIRLGERGNVDHSAVEAGRQVLSAGRRRGLLPLLLLGRQADAAGTGVDDRGGIERGELSWTDADEIIDDLPRSRQRREELGGERRQWLRTGRRQNAGVEEAAQRVAAACEDRRKRRQVGRGGRVLQRDERIDRAALAAGGRASGGGIGDGADGEGRARN